MTPLYEQQNLTPGSLLLNCGVEISSRIAWGPVRFLTDQVMRDGPTRVLHDTDGVVPGNFWWWIGRKPSAFHELRQWLWEQQGAGRRGTC